MFADLQVGQVVQSLDDSDLIAVQVQALQLGQSIQPFYSADLILYKP